MTQTAADYQPAAEKPMPSPRDMLKQILGPLASLKLTVWLFVASMFLIFVGTVAQVDHGIWQTMSLYFRSFLVWVPFQLLVPGDIFTLPGSFPFPGGFIIGGLLLINLVAAHLVRFKISWKRSGILMMHAGVVMLLLSELVTAVYAVEGQMGILVGESSDYVEDNREVELAIIDPGTGDGEDAIEQVIAIPQSWFEAARRHPVTLSASETGAPFDIVVERFMRNSEILGPAQARGANVTNPADMGLGTIAVAREMPTVTGTDTDQKVDVASAYVTLMNDGEPMGTWLASVHIGRRQEVELADGSVRTITLRFKREYKDYEIHLEEFHHDKFVGTNTPRNFQSDIRLTDKTDGRVIETKIWMNHPLRYKGETFYQASFFQGDTGTVLQVVRNPAWRIPYIACTLITLGMLIHFGMHLFRVAQRML